MTSPECTHTVKRRPKDRKNQIVVHARELFVEHGFPNVSMVAIADSVGIRASALYRHFNNKNDLLAAVFKDSFAYLADPISSITLDDFVDLGVGLVNRYPFVGILWFREIRYLPAELQMQLRARFREWTLSLLPLIRQVSPGLDRGQEELLMWTFISILASLYSRAGRVPKKTRVRVVRSTIAVVAEVPLIRSGERLPAEPRRYPQSRRERLLQAAVEQFGSLGYSESSLASIGTAADVSGPNLYSYFESKSDLLQAVLDRGNHAAWFTLDNALTVSNTVEEALSRLVQAQLAFSPVWTRWAIEPEYGNEKLERLRDSQREYTNEWVALLCAADPDLSLSEARVRVGIAMAVLNDLSQTPRVCRRDSFLENVQAIARAALFNRSDLAHVL